MNHKIEIISHTDLPNKLVGCSFIIRINGVLVHGRYYLASCPNKKAKQDYLKRAYRLYFKEKVQEDKDYKNIRIQVLEALKQVRGMMSETIWRKSSEE